MAWLIDKDPIIDPFEGVINHFEFNGTFAREKTYKKSIEIPSDPLSHALKHLPQWTLVHHRGSLARRLHSAEMAWTSQVGQCLLVKHYLPAAIMTISMPHIYIYISYIAGDLHSPLQHVTGAAISTVAHCSTNLQQFCHSTNCCSYSRVWEHVELRSPLASAWTHGLDLIIPNSPFSRC